MNYLKLEPSLTHDRRTNLHNFEFLWVSPKALLRCSMHFLSLNSQHSLTYYRIAGQDLRGPRLGLNHCQPYLHYILAAVYQNQADTIVKDLSTTKDCLARESVKLKCSQHFLRTPPKFIEQSQSLKPFLPRIHSNQGRFEAISQGSFLSIIQMLFLSFHPWNIHRQSLHNFTQFVYRWQDSCRNPLNSYILLFLSYQKH